MKIAGFCTLDSSRSCPEDEQRGLAESHSWTGIYGCEKHIHRNAMTTVEKINLNGPISNKHLRSIGETCLSKANEKMISKN